MTQDPNMAILHPDALRTESDKRCNDLVVPLIITVSPTPLEGNNPISSHFRLNVLLSVDCKKRRGGIIWALGLVGCGFDTRFHQRSAEYVVLVQAKSVGLSHSPNGVERKLSERREPAKMARA
ncbi:hypothetical protein AVEN_240440-1 [Araneus ventricosus]|uniref:Uncharacterized protein n=1 Tax=Araneus ventricosus TaxID=182803 RepID=A0A4Y2MML5_ARAVE|nr:hypothetical protein AVEN_240440-1 [Araneus ventricosus]